MTVIWASATGAPAAWTEPRMIAVVSWAWMAVADASARAASDAFDQKFRMETLPNR